MSVGSHLLDVTLLRGANSDPTVRGPDGLWQGPDIDLTHGSEWNRLMYPIHSGNHTDDRNPDNHSDPTTDPFGSWASYSDDDLLVQINTGNGNRSWCQEVSGDDTSWRIARGFIGVSYLARNASSYTNSVIGWRPCLRLVT